MTKGRLKVAAWTNEYIKNDLRNTVQQHVYGQMPIRMIKLPGMNLLSRTGVVRDITRRILEQVSEAKIEDKTTHVLLREKISEEDAYHRVIQEVVDNFGQYAILSHTWLQDEEDSELTYGDLMRNGTEWPSLYAETNGAGYRKVFGFCKIAHSEGYPYAWMDTVCINQDSTSELDESIRSMYRWYQRSSMCMAYLADTASLSDMGRDRWFTRGWTLQELLAPQKIKFYNKNWKFLGATGEVEPRDSKNSHQECVYDEKNEEAVISVEDIIEEVAGIAAHERIQFMSGMSTTVDVSHRMRWAAHRTTTRGEDQAYCLMGIFGVSFSIAYGEGAERAFFRLIEAILTSFRDLSDVLVWGGKPISDEIHSSSLIPSSPKCYLRSPAVGAYFFSTFIPAEPLLLTHIGLRIRVLLIRGEYRSSSPRLVDGADMSICLKINWNQRPLRWHEYDVFSESSTVRLQGNNRELNRQALVLGIWNVEDDSNVVVLPPIP
ncbi:hypothetical protein HYPSUDRAFT_970480 [Hypholoma sublateritium FD-334 SS-4]|uniref:Heterokaryon incompatibility domain-containing protein n=1 Tax=Hypholoma sublateritium (strain FD-334 SS-4) TaxID=945553 RepID=A0A0D2PCQ0_HYPSF|nr:hypothetical protein HYPSUDRAFT_970480 [Hypholoma sublateritium FD-334 SS-4]